MILTFELEPELEIGLQKVANQEHSSPTEMAKKFIRYCLSQNQTKENSVTKPFTDWDNAAFTEMAMNQAMRGMENEPSLYESLTNDEQNTQQLLEMIKNIKPVKARYSSEILVRELRDEKTISPITQSLIGLLANSNLDESNYKKHLEDKYL
jgi:hypothetical protein